MNSPKSMPPLAPLVMPQRSFSVMDPPADLARIERTRPGAGTLLARLAIFGGAAVLTAYAGREMLGVVSVGQSITVLQWLLVALFVINVSWIALAAANALAGFLSLLIRQDAFVLPQSKEPLLGRTAIIMPVYNEDPAQWRASLKQLAEDLADAGMGPSFDIIVLSDTRDPAIRSEETTQFALLLAGSRVAVHYRHRARNTQRKTGNIADFLTRWGGRYRYCLVLDADSTMDAALVIAMVRAVEKQPDLGLLQSLPIAEKAGTRFAASQQFASRVYGPLIAEGTRLWSSSDGNFYGHNAIFRTAAFADCCGLPRLKGQAPLGGDILSHDFVEAALLRRAGWTVALFPHYGGSHEETPPNLIDHGIRDRRWAQGNLQHMKLLASKGFKLASRQHLLAGIFAYLASPLWLAQLVIGLVLAIQVRYLRPEYFTSEFTLYPTWPRFDSERSLDLLMFTLVILLLPKALGLLLALIGKTTNPTPPVSLIGRFVQEILTSAMIAPILMLIQSKAVYDILVGRDSGWKPQRRAGRSISIPTALRRHWRHMLVGIVAGLVAFSISLSLGFWLLPTLIGLAGAALLSWWTAQPLAGLAAERRTEPLATFNDPEWVKTHQATLEESGDPQIIDPVTATASIKLGRATSRDHALAWLGDAERLAAFSDPELFKTLLKLR
jgi:membrane glycosyltransferase